VIDGASRGSALRWLLYGLIIASLPGAVVTSLFRIETTGVNLDNIGEEPGQLAASKAVA
jgi:hypothetical protein